jgi:hypothetical protein
MNPMFRAMQPKVKKPYSGPPRPNLLSHEKVLKDTKITLEQLQYENRQLKTRLEAIESKLLHQTNYMSSLHNAVASILKRK